MNDSVEQPAGASKRFTYQLDMGPLLFARLPPLAKNLLDGDDLEVSTSSTTARTSKQTPTIPSAARHTQPIQKQKAI